MSARDGMTSLIETLRGMTYAGTNDATIGTTVYWTDNHIQNALDRHRADFMREELIPYPSYIGGGSVSYLEYRSEHNNLEGGTVNFILENALGVNVGTAAYTADYDRGIITFGTDTEGSAYYLTGRTFDLNGAAADVWRQKAAHVSASFSFSTDNHRVDRGAVITNCLKMADYYSGLADPVTIGVFRSDNWVANDNIE